MGLCLLFMMELIKAVQPPVRVRRRVIENPLEEETVFAVPEDLVPLEDDPGVRLEIRPLTSLEDMLLLTQAKDLYGDDLLPFWGGMIPDLRATWRHVAIQ